MGSARGYAAGGRKELGAAISAAAAAVDLIASIAPATDPRTAAAALCGGSPAAPPRPDPSGPRAAMESLAAAAVARAAAMHDTVAFDSHQHLWEGLCRVRAEGLKLLAEYSALCMQHLAFLAMCLEGGDTTAAGLNCSDGAPLSSNARCRTARLPVAEIIGSAGPCLYVCCGVAVR